MSAFGIDFGTTTTAAAELDGVRFRNFGHGQRPLSSTVAIDLATGKAIVGPGIRSHIQEHASSGNYEVIRSIKTLLDTGRTWKIGAELWTPARIAGEVLKAVNSQVTLRSGIPSATFSVPVDVRPAAVRVLREAAQIAGITVNGVIKESTAALFRYIDRIRACRYVAVFDWGGGTLDVSILEIRGGTVYERYTKGMPEAGDQVDENLARRIHPQWVQNLSFDDTPAPERDALLLQCENAKRTLSASNTADLEVRRYGGQSRVFTLTREFAKPAIEPLVWKAISVLTTAISAAGLSPDAIEQIIVIGGSSRLWLLREMLEADERLASVVYFSENPEWDVARGAAVVDKSPGCYSVAETLALELSDGSHYELVRPGDRIDGRKRSVSLALVEDVRAANLVIDRWSDYGHRELATQFTVATQGFDLEAVELSWELTEELTLAIVGRSRARGLAGEQREITPVRFGYDIGDETTQQSAIAV